MSHFLIELISEEIPAFLQEPAADKLAQSLENDFADINLKTTKVFAGVRRIAVLATVDSKTKAKTIEERGPKTSAPTQAKEKFSEKHNVDPSELIEKDGYWFIEKHLSETSALDVLSEHLPALIWNFKWPKMLRWGQSQFQWIRPLRQIVCFLDDKVVPFSLARGNDDGNGIKSAAVSSGIHSRDNSSINISSAIDWENELKQHGVIASRADRLEEIEKQTEALLKKHNLKVNLSEFGATKLNNELAGLTEAPTVYLGKIDNSFMKLPTEVRDISMRAHQRYIPLATPNGESAPYFLFAANGSFPDNGKQVIAGNESVLTARLEDARHFWDIDRQTKLEDRLDHLSNMSFHSKLGSQKDRSIRLEKLSKSVATEFGLSSEEITNASRAGLLAKADLQSQMVGEFPELQGIMGAYYAQNDKEHEAVASALRSQYTGVSTETSTSNIEAVVSIADRLDTLVGFFGKDMKPSGSKDPYALRRKGNELLSWTASLENRTQKSINLIKLIKYSAELFNEQGIEINLAQTADALTTFFNERLSQFLPTGRKDLIFAISPEGNEFSGNDPLLSEQASKVETLEKFLSTPDGDKLMQISKRLSNILENDKEVISADILKVDTLEDPAEVSLSKSLDKLIIKTQKTNFEERLHELNTLSAPLNNFFEKVMVFDENEKIRYNRVSLLKKAQKALLDVVDFTKIQHG